MQHDAEKAVTQSLNCSIGWLLPRRPQPFQEQMGGNEVVVQIPFFLCVAGEQDPLAVN